VQDFAQDFVQDFGLFEREEILPGILQKPPRNSRFFAEVFARFPCKIYCKIPSRPLISQPQSAAIIVVAVTAAIAVAVTVAVTVTAAAAFFNCRLFC
jgi:hypothetical protein